MTKWRSSYFGLFSEKSITLRFDTYRYCYHIIVFAKTYNGNSCYKVGVARYEEFINIVQEEEQYLKRLVVETLAPFPIGILHTPH